MANIHIYNILLEKLVRHEASQEERDRLEEWLGNDERQEETDEADRRLWASVSHDMDEQCSRDVWAAIQNDMDEVDKPRRNILFTLGKIAASILLLVGVGLATYIYGVRSATPDRHGEVAEMVVDNGQKARMVLPDGTKVWLNSGSRLTYNADYNVAERIVKLNGEAYFEVAKNAAKRFVVSCNGVNVEALGTIFNVKGYHGDSTVTASLVEGKVKVSDKSASLILMPNQQVSYNHRTHAFLKQQIDDVRNVDFRRGDNLYFRSVTLAELAKTLERQYGVKVVFKSNSLRSVTFAGSLSNNGLDSVLHVIAATYPLNYERQGNTVVLSKRRDEAI